MKQDDNLKQHWTRHYSVAGGFHGKVQDIVYQEFKMICEELP